MTHLIEFIAEDKPGAARRVLEVIEQCVDHIATFPESAPLFEGVTCTELSSLRRAVIATYRAYAVYYFIHEHTIEIVSVRRAENGNEWLG